MYHGEWRKRARSRSTREGKTTKLTREGRGGSLGEGRRVKQRTVEKWLPPGAGRRNIKGNRLLVREVKNRPSPGHTRIAFIHLLYVLYQRSVIPFRRTAPRGGRDTRGITQIPPTGGQTGVTWLVLSESFHPSTPFFVLILYAFALGHLIFLYDRILCIIYTTYRHQCYVAASLE